ncbi:ATP synthase F0 subunit B [Erysipelothrix sp. HDW6C]|uniref:ATP synthase F0 subunit B n=1 Tax=Erysipelothrix sp. HDW6C TaxID=2714930 RepID=UPI00140C0158|nr:ATP synthase F0 subunit B [Erysipelothrix sp. HDW6C]QIK69733.1 ATP synthase F0 subunit B [Erysipelothrix sp. HDW6C]
MDLDIAQKLMPNLLTMAAQLGATYVIYLMYKKYLHEPVQKFLDMRAEAIANEVTAAQQLKEESLAMREQSAEDYEIAIEKLKRVEQEMLAEANRERQAIVASAQDDIQAQKQALIDAFEIEKQTLFDDVSDQVLSLAVAVNRKVISQHEYENETMINDLEKEIRKHHVKH